MSRESWDVLLGQRAIARGMLDAAKLPPALAELASRREKGAEISLAEVLFERGLLQADQVRDLIEKMSEEVLVCAMRCRDLRFFVRRLDAGKDYRCRYCGAPLVRAAQLPNPPRRRHPRPRPMKKRHDPGTVALFEVSASLSGPLEVWRTQAMPEAPLPRILGPYRIDGTLGQGGMGVVYRAYDEVLDRHVALKVLPDDLARRASLAQRFLRESRVQGRLEHPNICPVHVLGHDDANRPYFTMKLVQGQPLTDVILDYHARRGASLTKLIETFLKVCDAVAFAHSRGVLHRDLKPDNVMVGAFGEVLVMDWGLAKVAGLDDHDAPRQAADGAGGVAAAARDSDVMLTQQGDLLGTLSYMSPEQAAGRLDSLDERADVYALGAILYEILCGQAPFDGAFLEVYEKVRRGKVVAPSERHTPPPVSQRRSGGADRSGSESDAGEGEDRAAMPDESEQSADSAQTPQPTASPARRAIPRELEAVALKAMSFKRAQRYRGVPQLRADVEAWLEGRPLASVEYSRLERAAKWVKRHRALSGVLAVAALAMLAVVGVLLASAQERRLQRERDEAVRGALERRAAEELERERSHTLAAKRQGDFERRAAPIEALIATGSVELLGAYRREAAALARDFPDLARSHYLLGRWHQRLGEFPAAREHLERTLRLAPDHDLANYHLGLLLCEWDQTDRLPARVAETFAAIDRERAPGAYFAAQAWTAFLLHRGSFFEEIQTLCDQGLTADPTFADLHWLHGTALARHFTVRMFVREKRRAVETTASKATRDWPAAEAAFRRCLGIHPGHERALRSLATSLAMQGRFEEAVKQFESLEAALPPALPVTLDLINVLTLQGDVERLGRVVERAAGIHADQAEIVISQAVVAYEQGQWPTVRDRAERARELLATTEHRAESDFNLGMLARFLLVLAAVKEGRLDPAKEAWLAVTGFLVEHRDTMRQRGESVPPICLLMDIPPTTLLFINQMGSLHDAALLRRPWSQRRAREASYRQFLALLDRQFGLRSDMLADLFETRSYSLSLLGPMRLVGMVFRGLDTRDLSGRGLAEPHQLQPGTLVDLLRWMMAPMFVARYLKGLVHLAPSEVEDAASTCWLLDQPHLSVEILERLMTTTVGDGGYHFELALLLALSEDPPRERIERLLEIAHGLGFALEKRLDDPAFAALTGDDRFQRLRARALAARG